MKIIGVACLGTEPPESLKEKARLFVARVREFCGANTFIALGGYWGLMRVVADEALARGLGVIIFPPLEREAEHFPDTAIVVRTGMGFRLRSVVLARTADVLVALGGEAGTMQEVFTAYLEGKPIFVLGGTGLSTDKLTAFAPYIDSRALAAVKIVEDPVALAEEACRVLTEGPVARVAKAGNYEGPRV